MFGAIIGDMAGEPFEFDRGGKTKDFKLFEGSRFTDDTVMTVAVADALMKAGRDASLDAIRKETVRSMQAWGRKYPRAGYGGRFAGWLWEDDPKPYNSYGNGAAMRISPVGWFYTSLERTLEVATAVTDVTHNHPEGIKGALATAAAIFLARNGASKEEIKDHIITHYGYDLSRTCDEIRPGYRHVESCQETVPEAITAFLEGTDFEDVIRTAVSLGGDADTLTCIAGSIAEAFYGVPIEMKSACIDRLTAEIHHVMDRFKESRIVLRSDWNTLEMPERNETFTFDRPLTAEEIDALSRGHIPEAMEDKWFWYVKNGVLYAHRSWTGYCIYEIGLTPAEGPRTVRVNRDPEQHRNEIVSVDIETVGRLLDHWSKAR